MTTLNATSEEVFLGALQREFPQYWHFLSRDWGWLSTKEQGEMLSDYGQSNGVISGNLAGRIAGLAAVNKSRRQDA